MRLISSLFVAFAVFSPFSLHTSALAAPSTTNTVTPPIPNNPCGRMTICLLDDGHGYRVDQGLPVEVTWDRPISLCDWQNRPLVPAQNLFQGLTSLHGCVSFNIQREITTPVTFYITGVTGYMDTTSELANMFGGDMLNVWLIPIAPRQAQGTSSATSRMP